MTIKTRDEITRLRELHELQADEISELRNENDYLKATIVGWERDYAVLQKDVDHMLADQPAKL